MNKNIIISKYIFIIYLFKCNSCNCYVDNILHLLVVTTDIIIISHNVIKHTLESHVITSKSNNNLL